MTSIGYEEAEAYLNSLGVDAMKGRAPSLHRMEAICRLLAHPERSIPAIHVTGTNGKTSTARIATSILAATGLKVGTYTSPHLNSIRERIALSGEWISELSFAETFEHLFPYLRAVEQELDEKLSYFEVLTALFFLWAAEQPVDALVVEVGLGGRWDATNVVDAPVSVITNVGLDHVALLGDNAVSIAREKAGIIKPAAFVVTGERAPNVLSVIRETAEELGARVSAIDDDFAITDNRVALGGRYLSLRLGPERYEGLFVPLHGAHQGVNAALALESSLHFLGDRPLAREVVAEGLASTVVPGRLEIARPEDDRGPAVIFDVAHNADGMAALVRSLAEAFAFERVRFVVGILADKDFGGMMSELARLPSTVVVTQPQSVRSAPVEELESAARELGLECEVVPDVARAVRSAIASAEPAEIVCVTGSHYVVGEARTAILSDGEAAMPSVTRQEELS